MWFTKEDIQPELRKWEQEVVALGCAQRGAQSHVAYFFCIRGLQDRFYPLATDGILAGI